MNPQSLNRYSYVLNNPTIYVDVDGNVAMLAPAIYGAIAGGIGGFTGGLSQGKVPAATGFVVGGIFGFLTGAAFAPELSFQAGKLAAVGTATYVALATNWATQVVSGVYAAGKSTPPKSMTPLEAFVTQINPYQFGLAGLSAGKVLVTGRAFKDVIGGHPGSFVESTYSGFHGGLTDFLGTVWQSSQVPAHSGTVTVGSPTLLDEDWNGDITGCVCYDKRLNNDFAVDKSKGSSTGQGFSRSGNSANSGTQGFGRLNGGSMIPRGSEIFPDSYIGPGDPRCQWDGC